MSTPDFLSLKWNNHESAFQKLLSALHFKSQFEDATVACSGKLFPVHRLVLSCCSNYFEQMFVQTQGKHSIIVLKDISAEIFQSLLSYMYLGETNVKKELLSDLLMAAHALEIKGLGISDEEDLPKDRNSAAIDSNEKPLQNFDKSPKKRPLEENRLCESEHSTKIQKIKDNTLSSSIPLNTSSVTTSLYHHDTASSACQNKQLTKFSPSNGLSAVDSNEKFKSFAAEEKQEGSLDIKEEALEEQNVFEDSSYLATGNDDGVCSNLDQTAESGHFMNISQVTQAALMASCTSNMHQDPLAYIPRDWNPSQQIALFPGDSTLAVFLMRSRMGSALLEAYRAKRDFTTSERSKLVALIIDGLLDRFESLRNCHFERIAEDLTLVFPTEFKEIYFIGPRPELGKKISRGKLVDRYRNQSRWRKKKMREAALNNALSTPQ